MKLHPLSWLTGAAMACLLLLSSGSGARAGEKEPDLTLRGEITGKDHQPANADVDHGVHLLDQVLRSSRSDSKFRFLTGNVHLNQDFNRLIDLGGHRLDFLRQTQRIHAMDQSRQTQNLSDFVALQMTNHVPAHVFGNVCGLGPAMLTKPLQEFIDLRGSLNQVLHLALGQIHVPQLDQFADLIDCGVLGHRDQNDRIR